MEALILTADNFATEVEQSDVPVLVDFWAPWCGPCKVQGPIVQELATDYAGKKVKIAKLNVDEARSVSEKFGILHIPTLIIFKAGQPLFTMVGLQTKASMAAKLDQAIA